MCQDCSFVCYNDNMNCVHCIDGNNGELEDNDDIVMYLNFWSMFCQPLLYRLCIQCHVTCCCFRCVSSTRLLIKSSLKSGLLCCIFIYFLAAGTYFGACVQTLFGCRCSDQQWVKHWLLITHTHTHTNNCATWASFCQQHFSLRANWLA